MKNKRLYILVLISAVVTLSVFGHPPAQNNFTKAEKVALPNSKLQNFYQIDNGIYRSEQPSTEDFIALEKLGIREALSLRNYNDDLSEIRKTTIKPHTLRTRASTISEHDLISALKIIKNRQGPILIHCWHGSDRTGAVCAMYRIIFQGWSKEQAIQEMLNGGFGFHETFIKHITATIRSADIEKIKTSLL